MSSQRSLYNVYVYVNRHGNWQNLTWTDTATQIPVCSIIQSDRPLIPAFEPDGRLLQVFLSISIYASAATARYWPTQSESTLGMAPASLPN